MASSGMLPVLVLFQNNLAEKEMREVATVMLMRKEKQVSAADGCCKNSSNVKNRASLLWTSELPRQNEL